MEMSESPTPKPGAEPDPKAAVTAVGEAESSGKLKALDEVMTEFGWPTKSGDLLMLAQKDDRTKGKSPEEIADMLRADPSLYDDLMAYQPGGALDKPEATEESENTDPGMSPPDMEALGTFEGDDAKKAKNALKEMGRKPKDVSKSFAAKADFMSRMAE